MIRQLLGDALDLIEMELAQQTVLSFADLVITKKLRTIQFYTSDVVAQKFKMTPDALRKNIEREKFPAYKEGNQYLIPVTFVQEYRAERSHLTDEEIGLPLDKLFACKRKLANHQAKARAALESQLGRRK